MESIEVQPVIPASLSRLRDLATNLSFSWHRPTRALFEDLQPALWQQSGGNPLLMLRCVDQQVLDAAAADPHYLTRYHDALAVFDSYQAEAPDAASQPLVAYFCAEYGFHESFPIYSGGLGILAGDHCKAASDEGLNFVAVGLLYRQGYFTQAVDADGVQHPQYRDADPRDLPVERVADAGGGWLTVTVPIGTRQVHARVWRARVGRVSVYLLDTNTPRNESAADRDITFRLYGGDDGVRIRQEMVLGIGGARVLQALGLQPAVWHINEGHAAFLVLERLRLQMAAGLRLEAALELIAAQCAFTTHTPVAAGHDAFHDSLFSEHFQSMAAEMGLPMAQLLALGRAPGAPEMFNMTRLALNGTRRVNGVSRLHGAVSAQLCVDHWPEVPAADNPVGFITNGVHVPTFLAPVWTPLLDEVLPGWREDLCDSTRWQAIESVPDARYWSVAQDAKSRMLTGVRERLVREYRRKGLGSVQLRHITRWLEPANPDVLTLGFARRFATYKRAALLLRDRQRLLRLVSDPHRPVLLLFAGKAHPADYPGQQVLREIKQLMLTPEFAGRVVFLEDYDIQLARWLVTGVDVWLNNPVVPLEASGTSGIKAAINGRLNVSILDGWWAEGYDGSNGWGVPGADVQDAQRRDELDCAAMLDVIEEEVVPMYYARNASGHSPQWVQRSKRAMASVVPAFNMRRVVRDYSTGVYQPAAVHAATLAADAASGAVALAEWKTRVRAAWDGVRVHGVEQLPRMPGVASPLCIRVRVDLGGLVPADLRVSLQAQRTLPESEGDSPPLTAFGHAPPQGNWQAQFELVETSDDGATAVYELATLPPATGQYRATLQVYPWHPLLAHPLELGLLRTV
jgi:starch phosphorylase